MHNKFLSVKYVLLVWSHFTCWYFFTENQLTYSITGGNIGNAFEVSASTGVIRVRGNLDYEEGPRVCYPSVSFLLDNQIEWYYNA